MDDGFSYMVVKHPNTRRLLMVFRNMDDGDRDSFLCDLLCEPGMEQIDTPLEEVSANIAAMVEEAPLDAQVLTQYLDAQNVN